MRKFFLFIGAMMLAVTSLQASERVVWAGNQPISWASAVYDGITLEVYNLQGLEAGDVIKVYGTPKIDPASIQYRLKYKAGGSWTWTDLTTNVEDNVASYVVESATTASEIAERGLIVTGQGYDVTKITITTNNVQKEVWCQEALRIFYVDGSNNYSLDTYNSIDISAIRPGYTLKVYTENPEESPSYQLQFKDGADWDVWKTIANAADANGVVSHVIDSVGQAQKLRDRGLVVNGDGYSINRISVEKSRRYTLWEGSKSAEGWWWLNGQGYLVSDITQLAENDKIIVTISGTNGDDRQLKIVNQENQEETPTFGDIAVRSLDEGEQVIEFTLTADNVSALKAGYAGIILTGTGCTMTKVELLKASKDLEERTLWQYHGKQISWNNEYYPGSPFYTHNGVNHLVDFSGLRSGATIRFYVTAGAYSPTYQISDRSGTDWAPNELTVNTTNAPTTPDNTGDITYTVDAEKAAVIAERGLLITGQGFDLNRIVIEIPAADLTLNDNVDETAKLSRLAGLATSVDLTINRTLYRDGYYNTICLPFSIASLDGTPLAGATVMELVGTEISGTKEGGDMTLDVTIDEVSSIVAGKPYLISFPSGSDITTLTFNNVTISATSPSTTNSTHLNMVGIFAPTTMTASTDDELFLGDSNTLYWSDGSDPLKGFRAYFKINGGSPLAGMPARFVTRPQMPTDIDNIVDDSSKAQKVLRNGQLVIIREGKQYNALGNHIQ